MVIDYIIVVVVFIIFDNSGTGYGSVLKLAAAAAVAMMGTAIKVQECDLMGNGVPRKCLLRNIKSVFTVIKSTKMNPAFPRIFWKNFQEFTKMLLVSSVRLLHLCPKHPSFDLFTG